MLRIVVSQAENSKSDRFRHNNQERVLEKESVTFDFPAVDQLQELCPKLPLQRDRRLVL